MPFRVATFWIAAALLVAAWGIGSARKADPRTWVRPIGASPAPVRILQFRPSVVSLTPGEKATICYGVENAKSVKISPSVGAIFPSLSRCVEIGPVQTTHYMLMAEGYDGRVATSAFTISVHSDPPTPHFQTYALSRSFHAIL
jgi:hypothetical protein